VHQRVHDDITDQQLLEKYYATNETEWLGILLERYTMLLFGVCMKYMKQEEEAKDCVQQVFLKAITELKKYKVDYVKSWLYMVAKNHCLMKLRDNPAKYKTELSDKFVAPDDNEHREELVEKDKLLELIESCLDELNPEQKRCVTLFYLQKRSYQEIADETGFSLLHVKSYIQNGKRNLKIAVEKKLQKK
jgi:RNA polymerase sigma factor (sigma-70 family)